MVTPTLELASSHLSVNESMVPNKVLTTLEFFCMRDIPVTVSRNLPAGTCYDAAQKRNRGGYLGIPLSDELKTFFAVFQGVGDRKELVVINLAGDGRIDFDIVKTLLDSRSKVSPASKQIMQAFDVQFGEVNPFHLYQSYRQSDTLQRQFGGLLMFFDRALLSKQSNMMTNAGDLTWGIEFRVSEVVRHFPNVITDQSIVES